MKTAERVYGIKSSEASTDTVMPKTKGTRKQRVSYSKAGVDTVREEQGLERLTEQVRRTWPITGLGAVKLDIGYFANVIELWGGKGLALSADGVGTKVIIAQMLEKYDTVGIDCVAMNVNDLICVGATPLSMVDYIAVQDPDPDLLSELAKGLCTGAALANISISGGEIAQLKEIVSGIKPNSGFDLAGMAVGVVSLDKIIVGQNIQVGDVIIGIESNGIHSNGLTLARKALLEQGGLKLESCPSPLSETLGEELLKPTHIYVREAVEIFNTLPVKALIHITSDGFLNLTRVETAVGYVIDSLPPPPDIFGLIQEHGKISDQEMFRVYNMGIGFCVIVSPEDANAAIQIIQSHKKKAYKIGYTVKDEERHVRVEVKHLPRALVGKDDRFWIE